MRLPGKVASASGIAILGLILVGLPLVLSAQGVPRFPGGLGSTAKGVDSGIAVGGGGHVDVDGRRMMIRSILADAEQTVLAYEFFGTEADGPFMTIAPRPRLVLPDGTLVPFVGNSQDEAHWQSGVLVFAAAPQGAHKARVEIDGAVFRNAVVTKRFELTFALDNRPGYAGSARSTPGIQLNAGKASVSILEVSRTPSLTVVRGTFDGMTIDEIQALGRPDFGLVRSDGTAVETESGQLGFGEGYRSFELRFPTVAPGPAVLELRGFSADGSVSLASEFAAEGAKVALEIP